MRLVFFGTGAFALPALKALADHIILVVTQPDRPSGRAGKSTPSPAKLLALELGLPCASPEKARDLEFVKQLIDLEPEALVVASYGQILSQAVLDSARRGGINLHGSILPSYRGAAPIQRCLFNGDAETGVTLMQMDRGMDTGDIIKIERLTIGPEETYGALQDRLAIVAAAMAVEWMPKIVAGDYSKIPQDRTKATPAPKVEKIEAEVKFSEDAALGLNRYRGFSPNPGAFAKTKLGAVKLHKISLRDGSGEPGVVVQTSPELLIGYSTGALAWVEVQPEGKKRMSGRDFANGARLKVGDSLLA